MARWKMSQFLTRLGSWQNLSETGPVRMQRGGYFLHTVNHGAETFYDQKNHGAQSYFPFENHGADTFSGARETTGRRTLLKARRRSMSSISRTHTWVWVLTPSLTNPCMNPYSIYNNSLYESSLHLLQLPVWVLTPSITTPCTSSHSIYNNSLYESSLHL